MSNLFTRHVALTATKYLKRNVIATASWQQNRYISLPVTFSSSPKNDFRQVGTEKEAGALQELLRRVLEIDAEIISTPVEKFKPNTRPCVAYCTDDTFDINHIISSVSTSLDFTTVFSSSSNMVHILDKLHGGEIFLFSNGTFTCWGLNQLQQEKFITDHLGKSTITGLESRENVEYVIDEDELTDLKGDTILLNPHTPSIKLSKMAFSYGLGRAAKLTSIETMLDTYLKQFEQVPLFPKLSPQQLSKKNLEAQLLTIRQRIIRGSQDGFLGTADFQWSKLELQEYVEKISSRFNVYTRIQILNKKIEYAVYVTSIQE